MNQPTLCDLDIFYLRDALRLAEQAVGLTEPNPRVGCVIVDAAHRVIGRGHTQPAGSAHAEIMALNDAARAGFDVRDATAYVTLEPCSHHGRTPPCCDALVNSGMGRVVVAVEDPNPLVAGQGIARLRAAGIQVDLAHGKLADDARELNIGFFSRMLRQKPWVRMKIAASLDGRTALLNGSSQWITGDAARTDGHAWRRRASAVLTGVGTVQADNPRLDVRWVPCTVQPLRIIVDPRLDIDPNAKILKLPGRVLIFTASTDVQRQQSLRRGHLEIATLPARADTASHIDLQAMMLELGRRGINELHVEAGHRLNGALLAASQVDELLIYMAPRLIGEGIGMAALAPLSRLSDSKNFHFHDIALVGQDLRVIARCTDLADVASSQTLLST